LGKMQTISKVISLSCASDYHRSSVRSMRHIGCVSHGIHVLLLERLPRDALSGLGGMDQSFKACSGILCKNRYQRSYFRDLAAERFPAQVHNLVIANARSIPWLSGKLTRYRRHSLGMGNRITGRFSIGMIALFPFPVFVNTSRGLNELVKFL